MAKKQRDKPPVYTDLEEDSEDEPLTIPVPRVVVLTKKPEKTGRRKFQMVEQDIEGIREKNMQVVGGAVQKVKKHRVFVLAWPRLQPVGSCDTPWVRFYNPGCSWAGAQGSLA